jgi:AraC family L-rhamnose operon transcriptional activator RhaR
LTDETNNHVIRFQTHRFMGEVSEMARPHMQLVLALHGSGCLQTQNLKQPLETGDVVSIRPGVVYRLSDCAALQVIACGFFLTSFRESVGSALDPKALSVLLDSAEVKKYPISLDKFRSIAALLAAHPTGGEMGNIGRMLLLLETIVEHCKTPLTNVHRGVFQAVQEFDRELARDWSLPEIAAAIDLDPSYLARLFTSNLGSPPLAYLALLRAEEAAVQLVTQKRSCSSVGERVGWHDANYFSRRFRQRFGQSPTAFRERFAIPSQTG